MTVFKTFFRILKKNKTTILLYTIILLSFGTISVTTDKGGTQFEASKPKVLIVNKDENKGITSNLIKYIKKNCDISKIDNEEDKINDALFYQDVEYVIYIPENFNRDFLDGKNPSLDVKKGINSSASFAEILIKRYFDIANAYRKSFDNEEELVKKINETLDKKIEVKLNSKLDTKELSKINRYYSFASYSFLACLLFVICLILASFNSLHIHKRTVISSMDYKKHNRIILLSNCLYSSIIWLFYVIVSCILFGKEMFTANGLLYIANSLIFVICATALAFLIGIAIKKKEVINGVVNVIALGSSFLCGAFVPLEFLPSGVLAIAHIFPTYYFVDTNEILANLDVFSFDKVKPIIFNSIIMLGFTITFIIIAGIIAKKRRRI